MRTTVTIDDDVLQAVRERARRTGRSIGDVLSELARTALTRGSGPAPAEEFHGFAPLPSRGRPVTNAAIDALRGDEPEHGGRLVTSDRSEVRSAVPGATDEALTIL